MHEDAQHLRHDLRQVDPELGAERAHDLVQQQDDGRLHGALEGPVVLQTDMGGEG